MRGIVRYHDTLLKEEYYKERAISQLARYGDLLTDERINERLANIDMYKAIFNKKVVEAEEKMDAESIGNSFRQIQADLDILYKVLERYAVEEYEALKSLIEVHLREIESDADRYVARVNIETGSSMLGKTIFYMEGPLAWLTKDDLLYYDMGEIEVRENSLLGAIVEGDGINRSDVSIGIIENEEIIGYIPMFNNSSDFYRVEGTPKRVEYEVEIDESLSMKDTVLIEHPELEINQKSTYVAYEGKSKVNLTSSEEQLDIIEDISLYIDEDTEIEFYVKDATYIDFEMSSINIEKNFSGRSVTSPKRIQQIRMKPNEEFAFSILTDGDIYAKRVYCYIEKDKLVYPSEHISSDILLEESLSGEKKKYQAFLRVKSGLEEYPDVSSIAIKELLEKDVDIRDTV